MTTNNRVIWSEGLFIKPQHFQQEARYFASLLNHRIRSLNDFGYGFSSWAINEEHLSYGKLSLLNAVGVMPDGSVFDTPLQSALPEPLLIDDPAQINQTVYLGIPLHSADTGEMQWPDDRGRGRYIPEQVEVKDLHSEEGGHTPMQTAKLNACLLLEHNNRNAFSCLPLARIKDLRADRSIVLDEDFYPASLAVSAIPRLQRFLDDITGLIRTRAQQLAERVNSPHQSGVAEVSDFMMLQTLNRLHPQFQHLNRRKQLHPEQLYQAFCSASGELATFNEANRLPETYPAYHHDDCRPSFEPLMKAIHSTLGAVSRSKAINIPIHKEQYGTWSAPVPDAQLLTEANFVLAVKAQVPVEQIVAEFPLQAKVSSLEKISQMINLQLSGIPLKALPVTPRQLPYHDGFSYFHLDRNHPVYDQVMNNSAGFGFHIAALLPELELQFWAIRKPS